MSNNCGIDDRESRNVAFSVRDDGFGRIVGYAAVFNQMSEDLGGFRETISPGAFTRTIKQADVRALWQHDAMKPLGRTKAGTLHLQEDAHGLHVEIMSSDTSWFKDARLAIKEGLVDQMSFGFRAIKDDWKKDGEGNLRTLQEVELFDVSPVTFPAYQQTSVSVRSRIEAERKATDPVQLDHSDASIADPVPVDHSVKRKRLELAEKENI